MKRTLTCLLCGLLLAAATGPVGLAAETPAPGILMSSSDYRDMDWKLKLDVMRDLVAKFHHNKCAVALKPEDLMRIVDADLSANWKEESGDVSMGVWVCNLLQLDAAKCIQNE